MKNYEYLPVDEYTFRDLVHKNLALRHTHYKDFRRIFGVDLAKFLDNLTGFDVVKFDDDFIKAPDGTSTAQAVKAKYGQEGLDICNALIGYEESPSKEAKPPKKGRKHAK